MHGARNTHEPRVLRVDLSRAPRAPSVTHGGPVLCGAFDARLEPWAPDASPGGRIGAWSGSALGLALLDRLPMQAAHAALVISVADGVRRGLPTAARATLAARSPLTGRYTDGQVGSDLARRLVRCADALVLGGRTPVRGALLRIGRALPSVEMWSWPALCDLSPAEIGAAILREFGPCASVRTGWAGALGIRYASLAAGHDPQSFVGRGGLGAVFGALGLVALVVDAEPIDEMGDSSDAPAEERAARARLIDALAASPRLRVRARGGTLELAPTFAARGDLRARDYGAAWSVERAQSWNDEIAGAAGARHGCKGCPTPCGWTFDVSHGSAPRRGGRFSALYALGPNLGLDSGADALDLLARCDDAGLDAKELGAALAVLCRARDDGQLRTQGERAWFGDVRALHARIDELQGGCEPGALLAHGAAELARRLGVAAAAAGDAGDALRPESGWAALLGQFVSSRGSDPMRTNPFLLDTSRQTLERVLAPLSLPPGADDPSSPAGKGRIVWWHENLMAALDSSGFCAFSASALLADGIVTLDELADAIAPRRLALDPALAGAGPAERFLAAGASIVHVQRAYNERCGARARDESPLADALRGDASLWPEYARCRGLDDDGALTDAARARVCTPAIARPAAEVASDEPARAESAPSPHVADASIGTVELRCLGPLAARLGATVRLDIAAPIPLGAVLRELARREPAAAAVLFNPRGEVLPAVYRARAKLAIEDTVRAGDRLDLVVAIRGG